MSAKCRDCGAGNRPSAKKCIACGAALQAAAPEASDSGGISQGFAVPDGSAAAEARVAITLSGSGIEPFPLEEGVTVTLGRKGQIVQIAEALNRFDDVGRYHAHLTLRNGWVEIADQNSKNGVRIGDDLLPRGGRRNVAVPVTIRLGRDCVIRIEARP